MSKRKVKVTPPEQWDVAKPLLNPKGCPEPGWYIFIPNRDGDLRSIGPFPTKKHVENLLWKPCDAGDCKGLICIDPTDKIEEERAAAARAAGGGKLLCSDCQDEFVAWHKKTHGKPPTPVGVQ